MNTHLFKLIRRLTFFVIALLVMGQIEVGAQQVVASEDIKTAESLWGNGARALEGTWQTQATIRNCQTGTVMESFSKFVSFNMGGTAQETSSSTLFRSGALGIWQYNGGNSFRYLIRFFRFNPDGTTSGSVRAVWTVTIDEFSNTYEATANVQILAPNGNVVATACGSETATRLVFPD